MVFRRGLASLRKQLTDLGEMAIADRAVLNGPDVLAWHGRAYAQIAAYRGDIRLAVASQMPRSGSYARVASVLAQPGERLAVVVIQDADKLVHGLTPTCMNIHTVNLYSILGRCKRRVRLTMKRGGGSGCHAPRRGIDARR